MHVFQSFQVMILHVFSIFIPDSKQAMLIARFFDAVLTFSRMAIAHAPFPSAQDDGQSLVTSHQSLVPNHHQTTKKEPRRVPWFFGYQESISFFLVRLACSKCMLLV